MALPKNSPKSPHEILDPETRWFPIDETRQRKIAVKVVDIFGNDTMKVIEVNI